MTYSKATEILGFTTPKSFTENAALAASLLNASLVHPREVFRPAIQLAAAAIIVAHNHPSGDPKPSGDDIELTKRLAEAGTPLGIALLDHMVIGDGCDEYVSLRGYGWPV